MLYNRREFTFCPGPSILYNTYTMHDEAEQPVINKPEKDLPAKPITLHEVEEEIAKRVSEIDNEFMRGFKFIKDQPKSVTIFGSARLPETNPHYQRARHVGYKLAKLGYSIVTGGGPGIMEAANRGAFEADGRSLGLNIKLPAEQVANKYLSDSVDFYYFFIRKVMLSFSAEAYLFFPGGFGTFDELFEILTLVQTHKIEQVPIVLVGKEFWLEADAFIRKHMLGKGDHMVDADDMSLYHITDDEEEIVEIVKGVPIRSGIRVHHDLNEGSPS
jgi:uncharacterized protein (TIGR00730 family)